MSLSMQNQTGEEIAKIAHTLPLVELRGMAIAIQTMTYLLCIVCTGLVGLRIYVRTVLSKGVALGWDDYCALGGWLPFIPSAVLCVIATYAGLGAYDDQFTPETLDYYKIKVKEWMVYFELVYFGSSLLTKVAMAIMILRLSNQKRYKFMIWGSMGVLLVTATGCLGFVFSNCQPFQATWNEKLGHCRDPNGWIIISYAGSVVLALVDWTCAITPFFMLRALQMDKRRKLSVQMILGLGVFGSAAGLVRMPFYKYYDTVAYPEQTLYHYGHLILWSVLEAGLGIIACSLPPLRKLFSHFYRGASGGGRSGLKRSKYGTGDRSNNGTQLNNLTPLGHSATTSARRNIGKWDQLGDDDSGRHIICSTEIHIETASSRDDDSNHNVRGHDTFYKSEK